MLNVLLIILAVVDIVSGFFIFFHPGILMRLIFYLAVICLAKGGWSVLSSAIGGFHFDILGWLDILAGIVLLANFYSISFPFLSIVGAAMLLKGAWSLLFSITN